MSALQPKGKMPEGLMNEKLLSRLYFISLVFFASAPLVLADEHKHLCPDMSEHEQVLNEGMKMHKQYGLPPRSSFGRRELYSVPSSQPRQFRYVDDSTPSQREQASREYWSLREKAVDSRRLDTLTERLSAEKEALEFEEIGRFTPAKKLYERLLSIQKAKSDSHEIDLNKTIKNLERANLCEFSYKNFAIKQYSVALDSLDKVIDNIRASSFDMYTKSVLMTQLMNNFKLAALSKDSSSGLSSEDTRRAEKLNTQVEEQILAWKREMECLGMAQKLDRTAWKLELSGQYEMAEKLYKQALLIKHKNLGAESLETLAQNGDLARVCVALGRKREACRYYEDALKALRNHPNPGRTFVTMLENYGDMLDRLHEKSKSERIYEEARANSNKMTSSKI